MKIIPLIAMLEVATCSTKAVEIVNQGNCTKNEIFAAEKVISDARSEMIVSGNFILESPIDIKIKAEKKKNGQLEYYEYNSHVFAGTVIFIVTIEYYHELDFYRWKVVDSVDFIKAIPWNYVNYFTLGDDGTANGKYQADDNIKREYDKKKETTKLKAKEKLRIYEKR